VLSHRNFPAIHHAPLSTDSFKIEKAGKFSFIILEISYSFDNGLKMRSLREKGVKKCTFQLMLLMRFFFPAGISLLLKSVDAEKIEK
jgi:hypothetical protein